MTSYEITLQENVGLLQLLAQHGCLSFAVLTQDEPRPLPALPLKRRVLELRRLQLVRTFKQTHGRRQSTQVQLTTKGREALASTAAAGALVELSKTVARMAAASRAAAAGVAQLGRSIGAAPLVVGPSIARWKPGSYDGAELRPYVGRPGALRAFELPSRVNGEPVERARPACIAGGKLERAY